MSFTPKTWQNTPSIATPINAAALIDLETRLAAYTDQGETGIFDVRRYGATGNGTTDDVTAIQAAINAAEAAAYGGTVVLPPGNYRTSAPLTIKTDNICLGGIGSSNPKGGVAPDPLFGGSVIRPLPTFSGAWVLKCAYPTASTRALSGVDLRNFAIDGYYLPGTTGGILHQCYSAELENVHVVRCTGDGIYSEAVDHVTTWPKGAWDVRFRGVKCDGNAGHGLRTSPGSTDHIIETGIFEYNGGHGLFLEGSGTQVGDCDIYNNTGYGIRALTRSLGVADTRLTDNNGGIYLFGDTGDGADFNLSDLKIRSCSYSGDGTWDGITVAPTSAVRGGEIADITFSTLQRNGPANRMRYGINVGQYMTDLVLGPYSMGFISPATSTFTTAPVLDDGVNTKRLDTLPRVQILNEAQGIKGENFPAGVATAGQLMVDGTVYYMLVPVVAGQLISNIHLRLNAAGATLTFAKAGLHLPSTMARLAISTDRTTDWATIASNSFPKTAPLVTPYRVLADGALYVSAMAKGTTLPSFVRGANFGQAAMPFSGALAPFAAQVTQTDLPDPGSITNPSANLPINFWAGIS